MQRSMRLDVLKIFLAIAVVGIHANPFSNELLQLITSDGVFRVAVPVFFIISGYYFPGKEGAGAWLIKITFLYLFWMGAYSPIWFDFDVWYRNLIYLAFGYWHLWYLVATLFAGVVLFLCRDFCIFQTLIFSFVLYFAGSLLNHFPGSGLGLNIKVLENFWIYRNFVFFGFPMMALGYALNFDLVFDFFRNKKRVVFLGVFVLLIFDVVAYRFSRPVYGFDMPMTMFFIAPMIFVWFADKGGGWQGGKDLSFISSGIYYLHPFFLYIAEKYIGLTFGSMFLFALALSLVFAWPVNFLQKRLFKFLFSGRIYGHSKNIPSNMDK